jgi:hypothetical protein
MDIGTESPDYEIVEAPTETPVEQPSTLPAPSTAPAEPVKAPSGV